MTGNALKAAMLAGLIAAFAGGLVSSRALADQPYMHDALEQLTTARAVLAAGSHDKGGHRERAIGYVDRAIAEVQAGVEFSRWH